MLLAAPDAPMTRLLQPRTAARLCRWLSLGTPTLPQCGGTGSRARSMAGAAFGRRLIHSSAMWRARPDTLEEAIFNILKHPHHDTVSVTQLLSVSV